MKDENQLDDDPVQAAPEPADTHLDPGADPAPEQANPEVERLRKHAADLVKEKRALSQQFEDMAAELERIKSETTGMKAELLDFKTRDAWAEFQRHAGFLPEAAKFVKAELPVTIDIREGGNPVFVDGDGKIITDEKGEIMSPFVPEHVRAFSEPLRDLHPMFWPRAVGAGQTGDRGFYRASTRPINPAKPTAPDMPKLGLK